MNIDLNDIEIVGLNGAPLVECGRALPIARRKSDGMYCVLDLRRGGGSGNWYSEEEAVSFAENKQWTRFVQPVLLPQTCSASDGQTLAQQPMVVFADESLLDTADRLPRPPFPSREYFIWRKLQGYSDDVQAACGSSAAVESLLNDWATALLKRFDAMWQLDREEEYLKRIADFALCAATERGLRWQAYLRYATVQNPDNVRATYDSFTQREFPNVDWREFINSLQSLKDVLGVVPVRSPQPGAPSSPPSTALPKLRNIAAAVPIKVDEPVPT